MNDTIMTDSRTRKEMEDHPPKQERRRSFTPPPSPRSSSGTTRYRWLGLFSIVGLFFVLRVTSTTRSLRAVGTNLMRGTDNDSNNNKEYLSDYGGENDKEDAAKRTNSKTTSLRSSSTNTKKTTTTTSDNNQDGDQDDVQLPVEEVDFPQPFVHVIRSRFMQFQPNLTHLGFARLKLFEIFCLSTIKAQTNQNFLWVIATDPDLQPALKEPLIRMLQNQTNIVLIPNNLNRGESIRWPGILRDDAGKKRRPVWSGDYDLLEQYHKASLTRPTIMTRLDADDGLALEYVDEIQTMVHNEYLNEPNVTDASFKIFCPQHHLEWHYTNPLWQDLLNDSNDNSDGGDDKKKEKAISASILKPKSRDIGLPPSKYGYPVYIKRPHATCMTAGLSVLIGPTTQREAFPTAHHLIAPTVPECADNDDSPWKDGQKKPGPVYAQTTKRINCWQRTFVKTPGAVRSRTPTSAGMSGVSIEGVAHEMRHLTNETALEEADPLRASRFDVLQTYFRIDRDMLARTKTHFRQHIPDVAADNLQGQCTTGHSCHKEAQQKLKALTRLK